MNIMLEPEYRGSCHSTSELSFVAECSTRTVTKNVHLVSGAYCASVHAGIVGYAREAGWMLHDAITEEDPAIRFGPADGTLAIAPHANLVAVLQEQAGPVVTALGEDQGLPFPNVDVNWMAIGADAAAHFLSLGARRCVYYAPIKSAAQLRQWQGFSRALAAAGRMASKIEPNDNRLNPGMSRGEWLGERFLSLRQPLAVFADEGRIADVLDAAAILGWQVPKDVAVLGLDHPEFASASRGVAVSSVDTNRYRIGWEAAALLDRMMQGERLPVESMRIAPGPLAARQSTAAFACEHPGLTACIKLVRTRFGEALRLSDIANAGGLSTRALQAIFKKHVGRTVSEELLRVRLEHAAMLLRETAEKLDSVAQDAGFANGKYLCTVFRQAFGITPCSYRKAQNWAFRRW